MKSIVEVLDGAKTVRAFEQAGAQVIAVHYGGHGVNVYRTMENPEYYEIDFRNIGSFEKEEAEASEIEEAMNEIEKEWSR